MTETSASGSAELTVEASVEPWWKPLRGGPTNWLLDWDEPSVRTFTLVDIVERPPDAPAVIQA